MAQNTATQTKKLPLGVTAQIKGTPMETLETIKGYGFPTCQLFAPGEEYLSGARLPELKDALAKTGVQITTMFIDYEGQEWDLVDTVIVLR